MMDNIQLEDKNLTIDEIMRLYGQDILQLVFAYVKDKPIAEDLTQEIFIKCYKYLHTYKHESKIKTWIYRIAINHCKDHLKSWYHKNVMVTQDESYPIRREDKSVEEEVIQRSEDGELIQAVMALPTKYRELIYLFYFEEMQLKEIAEVTKQNVNTIKTRLRRAKAILQEKLGG
ncbi:sigma-70 family RNA polymerase sigma factor [Radiobacillus kanasensis]|nr:sigma-70 family RNA polymerase sigma factor [Radiobacillus kanasensis]UFU01414.1 sigma-70 family RNA polymerase sigma factor [Radiobacillus kanasensis]